MRRTPLKRYTQMNKRSKRPKKPKASTLKRKLWALFSEYVRRRNADHAGNATCVSCGAVAPWKQMQGGHFVRASAGMNTYFDETNVNVQCLRCNVFLDGNMAAYALYMVKTYGNDILAALDERRRVVRKISTSEYLELIEAYKSKLRALENREAA
jgi:hypothetical protein